MHDRITIPTSKIPPLSECDGWYLTIRRLIAFQMEDIDLAKWQESQPDYIKLLSGASLIDFVTDYMAVHAATSLLYTLSERGAYPKEAHSFAICLPNFNEVNWKRPTWTGELK